MSLYLVNMRFLKKGRIKSIIYTRIQGAKKWDQIELQKKA